MTFKLTKLTLVPATFDNHDYKWLNKFLVNQKNCLEELRLFSWNLQENISEGLCSLESLRKLTTHFVPPFFENSDNDTNCVVMKNLTHFRYYSGNTSTNFESMDFTKTLPNLQSLNVHFGLDHRLFGNYPDSKVESNPLKNFKNLKEFHIESYNQDLLHHLASPNLLTLATGCEDSLYDIASWIQMGKSLPKLETLIIAQVDKRFLKFIITNHEKYLHKLRNLKNLIMRDFENEVLHLTIEGEKVTKVEIFRRGNYKYSLSVDIGLEEKFEKIERIKLTGDEFDEKYEFLYCYFNQCGP